MTKSTVLLVERSEVVRGSLHYDMPISYVGHAAQWNSPAVDGSIDKRDRVAFVRAGRTVAVVTIDREFDSPRMSTS